MVHTDFEMEQDQPKGVITEEQLEQVWNGLGMKLKVARFWKELVDRGLGGMAMPEYLFVQHIQTLLKRFFVEGKVDEQHGRRSETRQG